MTHGVPTETIELEQDRMIQELTQCKPPPQSERDILAYLFDEVAILRVKVREMTKHTAQLGGPPC